MERTLPGRLFELEDFDSARADKLRGILLFAWSDVSAVAGNGLTLNYLIELNPDQHPVQTFQRDLGGGEEALKALVVDMANHPDVQVRSGYDLCQSIEQSLHIVRDRCSAGSPGTTLYEMSDYTRRLMSHTARRLAEESKPIRDVFDREDIDDIDPYSYLLPVRD